MNNNQRRNEEQTRRPVSKKEIQMKKVAMRKRRLKSLAAAVSLVASMGAVHAAPEVYDNVETAIENQNNAKAINDDLLKKAYEEIYNEKTAEIREFLVEDTANKINNSQNPEFLFNIFITEHLNSDKGTISNLYEELDVLKEKGFLFLNTDFDEYLSKHGKKINTEDGNIRNQRVDSTIKISDDMKERIATNQCEEQLEEVINEINSYGRSK